MKTALITLGVVLVMAVALFGVVSLCAPALMSDFTYSLGLDAVSADYALQEYRSSGDLVYLSRAFERTCGRDDAQAEECFDLLYADEGFEELCAARERELPASALPAGYRGYIAGLGACVKYRLADTQEEKEAALLLAAAETDAAFPASNPLYRLALEAAAKEDAAFSQRLLSALSDASYAHNTHYTKIVNILQEVASE